ncbi:MAG: methyltransferase domain-containing protein [Bdellovibrionaceae bacterium]|nr:methyltransferase domain-containing protein [Bdellovibrionales bacterium]MCB9084081.1 methyltransferase domain-containing protein [Pseudobdellovibrionaceae bacterium]
MSQDHTTLESVKDYYGKVLKTNKDLKTSACCVGESVPSHLRPIIKEIHSEVKDRFYGCGSPIPSQLEGCTVLDLGSGSGRDCYLLSKLVGESGRVIGVDMTDEQLEVARRHQQYHADQFGFKKSNVEFHQGYIEDLEGVGIPSNSVDVVVSNCVLNLSPSKDRVFREIFRVLKPGGELYFSDVFADRRIAEPLTKDPVLLGECLGGALYIEDFRRLLLEVGCPDFRVVSSSTMSLSDPEVEAKIGMVRFYSMTIRAFKLELEDRCEDFGQMATYKGTLPELPHFFDLDNHHHFIAGKPMAVCSNTARMLSQTRLKNHFEVVGDESTHFGLFDCSPPVAFAGDAAPGSCC